MANNIPPELEAKFKECKDKVMAEGNDEAAAYGICYTSVVEGKSIEVSTQEWMDAHPEWKIGARNSKRDQERLQAVHDFSVENGAVCHSKNALKAISETDDELRVGNYIVLFGGRDLEGIASPNKNQDGSRGEYFGKAVDLESSYTATGHLHVDWEHGQDPDGTGNDADNVLGYVDWKTAKKDEMGVYVERVLNRRNAYMLWLEDLIKAGLVGNSTQAVAKSVQKNKDGEIVRWPLKRDTLTVNPMEPRMLTENNLAALKALHLETKLIPSEAGRPDKDVVTTPQPSSKEKNEMEITEVKTLLDEMQTKLLADFDQKVQAAAKSAAEEALKALPEQKGGVAVTQDPADVPFPNIGEQMKAVRAFAQSHGKNEAPRLTYLKAIAAKAPTGMSEGVNADGGFLLDPTLSSMFLKPVYENGTFSSRVNKLPVGSNSNYGWINGIDSTSNADGFRWGGVTASWRAEASTVANSHPKFRRINWELHALDAYVFATDEQLEDTVMLTSIVQEAGADVINFKVNDAIYRGDGVGKPLGVLNSPALISIARTTLTQINWVDLISMWRRVLPQCRGNAIWVYNPECEPELDRLAGTSHAGTTEFEPRFVNYDNNGILRIKGRPAVASEFCTALGSAGDILVGDFSQFLFWEKYSGVKSSMNPWLYWDSGQVAWKFTYRCDGQTADKSAITPANGSATLSAFVDLSASTS